MSASDVNRATEYSHDCEELLKIRRNPSFIEESSSLQKRLTQLSIMLANSVILFFWFLCVFSSVYARCLAVGSKLKFRQLEKRTR